MIFEATSSELRREATLDYLRESKFDRVLDVGGALGPWAKEFVTHYLDLVDIHTLSNPNPDIYNNVYVQRSTGIVGDIEMWETWVSLRYDFPRFDFAICTQALEHVGNPRIPLIWMPIIADEGYIGVPSKFTELRKGVHYNRLDSWGGMAGYLRGFLPHRWIFTIREDRLWCWPKLPVFEHLIFNWVDSVPADEFNYVELSFRWKDEIPFKVVDDTYFDYPDGAEPCEFIRKELPIGI